MPEPVRTPLHRCVLLALLAGASLAGPARAASPAAALEAIEARRAERDWLGALSLIERARAATPDDGALHRLRALTLLDLGTSHRAWALYRARPEVFTPEESARFESARLARTIAWTGLYVADTATRDAAIARAEAALAEPLARDPLRTRFDALVLLNRAERHDEAVAAYRALRAEGHALPAYAQVRAADSLLAERHPDEAAALFEEALRATPEDFDARILLAYAYAESERFEDAYALLERLRTEEPAFARAPGARQSFANPRHLEADSNLALMRAYGQDTVGAQARLEALVAIGPANAGLQSGLGSVYAMRGWHARALERHRMATTLEPRHVGARIGEIEALSALGRDDLARAPRDALLAEHPRNTQVRRMERDWQVRRGWQVRMDASTGRSEGGGESPLGSRDGALRVEVESPLLADRWRVTAHAQDAWADFLGDRVRDRRAGAGLSYRFDRLAFAAGADRANDGWAGDRTGAYARGTWEIDDVWSVGLGWRSRTPDASLQARRAGITADALAFDLAWVPSERTRVDMGARRLRYDDGNVRTSLALDGAQRVRTRPHFTLDALASLYASRGTDDDVPYFNPERDASARLGLRAEHVTWRRYEWRFAQRATLSAGPYRQRGFGTAWVPQLRYEHDWQLGPGRHLQYGLGWSRPVYDGARETYLAFDLGLRWGD